MGGRSSKIKNEQLNSPVSTKASPRSNKSRVAPNVESFGVKLSSKDSAGAMIMAYEEPIQIEQLLPAEACQSQAINVVSKPAGASQREIGPLVIGDTGKTPPHLQEKFPAETETPKRELTTLGNRIRKSLRGLGKGNLDATEPAPQFSVRADQTAPDNLPTFPCKGINLVFLQRLRDYLVRDPNCDAQWSTQEVCDQLIKPWTSSRQSSFEEFLREDHMTMPLPGLDVIYHDVFGDDVSIFVSHAWKYEFVELVEAIETFFDDHASVATTPSSSRTFAQSSSSDRNLSRTKSFNSRGKDVTAAHLNDPHIELKPMSKTVYLWIDLFLNNQWAAPELPHEWWSSIFLSAIGKIGHTMLVLSPWDAPIPLTRAWCLWEILCTIRTGATLTVQLSSRQRRAFQKKLRQDFAYIMKAFSQLDVSNSEAANENDKKMIFEAVERSEGGFRGVNNEIMDRLRGWLTEAARETVPRSSSVEMLRGISPRGGNASGLFLRGRSSMCLDRMSSLGESSGTNDFVLAPEISHMERTSSVLHRRFRDSEPLTAIKEHVSTDGNATPVAEDMQQQTDADKARATELDDIMRLALLLKQQNKLEEVEQLYRTAFAGYETLHGASHTNTLRALTGLANVMAERGDLIEAAKLYNRVRDTYEATLGPDHPDTLGAVSNVATLMSNVNRLSEAETLFRRVLEGRTKALGATNIDTLRTVNNLANIYRKMKRYSEAENLLNQALKGREERLGATHPDTLATLNNLAALMEKQGRLEEALEAYQRVLVGRERTLGLQHPNTLWSVNSLAVVLHQMKRYEEAKEAYGRAFNGRKLALGEDHMDTIWSANSYGILLHRMKLYKEAEDMYVYALERRQRLLGADHSDTKKTAEALRKLQCDTSSTP